MAELNVSTTTATAVLNVSMTTATAVLNVSTTTAEPPKRLPRQYYQLLVVLFVLGIFGNLLALFILRRIRASSNQKHGFMLRCLISNDFIALIGMFALSAAKKIFPDFQNSMWCCRAIVVMRFFGLSSGCVAILMAVERWLALTKPFFYQRHISLRLLKRTMVFLWLGVLVLVVLPLFGIGMYWDKNEDKKCRRIRDAKISIDITYLCLYYSFIIFLCVAISYTNLAVMKALCMKENPLQKHNTLLRRISNGTSLACNTVTKEEKSFGKLMCLLCIVFVVCWVPHLITTLLTFVKNTNEKALETISILADMLLVVHFALDPYLYVLQHWELVKTIFLRRKGGSHPNNSSATVSRSSSMRTSYDNVPSWQPQPV